MEEMKRGGGRTRDRLYMKMKKNNWDLYIIAHSFIGVLLCTTPSTLPRQSRRKERVFRNFKGELYANDPLGPRRSEDRSNVHVQIINQATTFRL